MKKKAGKYRAVEGRVFTATEAGEHVQLHGIKVGDCHLKDHEIHFTYDTLPSQFDTFFPQDVFIVYQEGSEFFHDDRFGMMVVLRGFVTEMEPYVTMLAVEEKTGRGWVSKPEYKHTFNSIEERIGESR